MIGDSLRIVKEKNIALPSRPDPNPKDGAALAKALWGAGQTGAGFNVEVMLDRAVSHPIHVTVMTDIDAKYGLAADAQYHAILTTAMHDLARAYHLQVTKVPIMRWRWIRAGARGPTSRRFSVIGNSAAHDSPVRSPDRKLACQALHE